MIYEHISYVVCTCYGLLAEYARNIVCNTTLLQEHYLVLSDTKDLSHGMTIWA